MPVKNVTLSSIPYIVGVASLIVAAHYVAPSLDEKTLLRPLFEKSATDFLCCATNCTRPNDTFYRCFCELNDTVFIP
jgi:hypothetical protein